MADAAQVDGSDAVTLKVAGKLFAGWTEISIEIDLDACASRFELSVTKRQPGDAADWMISADEAAEVAIGGETVISGWIDRLESHLDAGSHSITVSGRSKAGDLVDCSAVVTPGSWRGRRLEEIAGELAKPFGLTVTAKTSTGAPFRLFALQQGETVWETIGRLCQHRGVLAVSTPEGNVEIVSPKPIAPAVAIVQGQQPLSISGSHDVTERFSRYILKGQSAGDDTLNGKAASAPKAEAIDPAVKRYRPLIVTGEDQADLASLKIRASWEATVRAARAQQATIALPGWRRADGALWRAMHAVDLDAPSAWIDASLMVVGIRFELNEQGRRSELRLVRPEAYTQLAIPEAAEASKMRKKKATAA